MDYYISEGNKIGALPAEFGTTLDLDQKAIYTETNLKKGQVVELIGDLKVAPTTAASSKVIGVAMFDTTVESGKSAQVAVETEGLFNLTAGGTITAGDQVSSGKDGTVITVAADARAIGVALEGATDGETVAVKFSI